MWASGDLREPRTSQLTTKGNFPARTARAHVDKRPTNVIPSWRKRQNADKWSCTQKRCMTQAISDIEVVWDSCVFVLISKSVI